MSSKAATFNSVMSVSEQLVSYAASIATFDSSYGIMKTLKHLDSRLLSDLSTNASLYP